MTGPVVRITILKTRGSTPREAGAVMTVDGLGNLDGTIGGGALEFHALARARAMLDDPPPTAIRETQILGPDLAQCCGGTVDLEYAWLPSAPPRGDGPRATVVVYGAGHIGRAVVRHLRDLPVAVLWIDDAVERFPEERDADNVSRRITALTSAAMDTPQQALHLVVTYSHAADQAICQSLLMRDDVHWVGLIASKTKAARFKSAFRNDGLTETQINRLRAPVGIGSIASKHPSFVALSIAAEIAHVVATMPSPTLRPMP